MIVISKYMPYHDLHYKWNIVKNIVYGQQPILLLHTIPAEYNGFWTVCVCVVQLVHHCCECVI